MKVTVGVLDKRGTDAVGKVLDVLQELGVEQPLHFGVVSPMKSVLDKNLELLSRQSPESSTAVGCISTKPTSRSYEFLQLTDASLVLQGKVYSAIPKTAVLQQLAKEPEHCEAILQTLLEKADGDYAFLMLREGWLAAGRDPVGVQPLYWGENPRFAAVATNRKALWMLGIENPVSFPPGNLAFINREGIQFKPVKTLSFS